MRGKDGTRRSSVGVSDHKRLGVRVHLIFKNKGIEQ
jgi:hypothetical protein